jgi:hypothetical protein
MRSQLTLLLCAVLLCTACHKKSSSPQKIDDVVYPSYSKLAAGNYWVYHIYDLDSSYNVMDSTNITDSAYVEKDTAIAGQTYHKYLEPDDAGGNNYNTTYLRDSLHYIVNNYGVIQFSAQDFTTIFYDRYVVDTNHNLSPVDTPYYLTWRMTDKDKVFYVPAGAFATSTWQTTYFLNAVFPAPLVRKLSTRYTAGVGKVSEMLPFYTTFIHYQERRLVRYHVQAQ